MNHMDHLSDDDVAVLVEALEAWETKDAAGEMMGDLLTAMLSKDITNAEAKTKLQIERDADRAKRIRERAARKDRSIMLRAKLIAMRNDRRVGVIEAAVQGS